MYHIVLKIARLINLNLTCSLLVPMHKTLYMPLWDKYTEGQKKLYNLKIEYLFYLSMFCNENLDF